MICQIPDRNLLYGKTNEAEILQQVDDPSQNEYFKDLPPSRLQIVLLQKLDVGPDLVFEHRVPPSL